MVWYAVVFYVILGVPGTYVYHAEFRSAEECIQVLKPTIVQMTAHFEVKADQYPETFVDGVCLAKQFNNLGKI